MFMKGNVMNFKNVSLFSILLAASFVGTVAHAFNLEVNSDLQEQLNKNRKKFNDIEGLIEKSQNRFKAANRDFQLSGTVRAYNRRDALFNKLKTLEGEYKEAWVDIFETEKAIARDLFRQIADQLAEDERDLAYAIEEEQE